MDKLIIGIEIGKSFHQASIINQSGQVIGGSIRFANNTSGADILLCGKHQQPRSDLTQS